MIKNILLLLAFISMPSVSFADSSLLPNEMITTSINSMNDQLGDQENKKRLEKIKKSSIQLLIPHCHLIFKNSMLGDWY